MVLLQSSVLVATCKHLTSRETLEVKFKKDVNITAEERAQLAGTSYERAMRRMAEVRKQVDVQAMADPAYKTECREERPAGQACSQGRQRTIP